MNDTIISSVSGSILNGDLAEGLCIIVPPGLTALRVEGKMFFEQMTGRFPEDAVDDAAFAGNIKGKHLLYVDTAEHIICNIDDMRELVNGILATFSDLGIKDIAMNGIRCDNRPDMTIRPEVYQREFIKEYIADHPGTFEKISLVDLHGGFNK